MDQREYVLNIEVQKQNRAGQRWREDQQTDRTKTQTNNSWIDRQKDRQTDRQRQGTEEARVGGVSLGAIHSVVRRFSYVLAC